MNYWRWIRSLSMMDRITNDETRRRKKAEKDQLNTIEEKTPMWYGHIIYENRLKDNELETFGKKKKKDASKILRR